MVRGGHHSISTILIMRMTKYTQKKTYSIVQTKIHIQNEIVPNTKSCMKLKYVPNVQIHTHNQNIVTKYKIYIIKIQNIHTK